MPTTFHFSLSGTYVTIDLANFHPMYMNQWNLSVQRQVGKDWLVAANYVGNSTIHMISGEDINPAVFLGLGPCTIQTADGPVSYTTCSTAANQQNRRILSLAKSGNRASTTVRSGPIDDGGTGEYEGLFLSAQKRLSHGVTLQANYTWSHCISDVYNGNAAATGCPSERSQAIPEQLCRDRSAAAVRSESGGDYTQILQPGAADGGEQLANRADPRDQVRYGVQCFRRHGPGTDHGGKPTPQFSESRIHIRPIRPSTTGSMPRLSLRRLSVLTAIWAITT